MTLRDREFVIPEMLVIVASGADAAALSPLAAMSDDVRSTLVATGPDPMLVDEMLDELGTPAGRILLPEAVGDDVGPALELVGLLPRLDDLVEQTGPAAVVVRGGTTAALAAAQTAGWRGVPLIALPGPLDSRAQAANRAMIAEMAAWQSSGTGGTPYPARVDLAVHQHLAGMASESTGGVIGISPGRHDCDLPSGLSA